MIHNGKDSSIHALPPSAPNIGSLLGDWQVPLILTTVSTTIVNFIAVKNYITKNIKGMWTPDGEKELELTGSGMRSWNRFRLITTVDHGFELNDEIIKCDIQYKIIKKLNYSLYGLIEYSLLEDYTDG